MSLNLSNNDENAELMRVLSVSRQTVYNYRVHGNSTGKVVTNGSWNDDEETIYKLLNDNKPQKNYLFPFQKPASQPAGCDSGYLDSIFPSYLEKRDILKRDLLINHLSRTSD